MPRPGANRYLMDRWPGMGRRLTYMLVFGVAVLLTLEVTVRALGMVNFPIYVRSPLVEYSLAPDQSGVFFLQSRWFVNDKGFANAEPFVGTTPSCMLVGDSVVYGGNPVDYEDRVGALAESKYGHRIWVAAVGGWSLLNELAFLQTRHAELDSTERLVFVLNNGDFGGPGPWTGEYAFPTERPKGALLYLARRYLLPRSAELPPIVDVIDPEMQIVWQREFDALLSSSHQPITILLYADRLDFLDRQSWKKVTQGIRGYAQSHSDRIALFDIPGAGLWSNDFYRNNAHPNLQGNRVIADLVATACKGEPWPTISLNSAASGHDQPNH